MSIQAKALIPSRFASVTQTTEYTAAAGNHVIVDKFTATNTDAAAVTISIHIVPSGGTVADSNQIVRTRSVNAGETISIAEMQNQILNPSELISCIASVASKLVIRASGREVTN